MLECNDGTLLRSYKTAGLKLIGFDLPINLIPFAVEGTTKIMKDYFNIESYRKYFPETKNVKVITSIAMFYDLEDPNRFVRDVAECLDENGVWIHTIKLLPSNALAECLRQHFHEHLQYYSMRSLENLLVRHGLEVFDVEFNDVNGGSFRAYIKHVDSRIRVTRESLERVAKAEKAETDMRLDRLDVYDEFASRVGSIRDALHTFVKTAHEKGKKIYVYGASTKGNTLLQYCRLDHTLIGAAAERNSEKWGKRTVGTLIPVISEEKARADKPDYFLVLPWHFMKEFKEREKAYLDAGGKFIIPLPEFKIVGSSSS